MVFRCEVCKLRARKDGSCRNESCAEFRGTLAGRHWMTKRLQSRLGDVQDRVGAFVAGGFVLTLLHRHDIRVGIASGMFLRHFVSDTARRLELLAVLYPCYWRWSTRLVLGAMAPRMDELVLADSNRRADIVQEAWDAMVVEMIPYQVVGFRLESRVDLLLRSDAQSLTGVKNGKECFGYHPYSNPASRRNGSQEVSLLLADLRSGSLWRACEGLAQEWRAKIRADCDIQGCGRRAASQCSRCERYVCWQAHRFECFCGAWLCPNCRCPCRRRDVADDVIFVALK